MRGTVMKRGSTWTYVLYLGRDASGKKQQKWVGGHRTKKEAEDALVEALTLRAMSLPRKPRISAMKDRKPRAVISP